MEKVKEMKNGYKLQAYPIKLENNDFPNGQDKAEAFVNLFAGNSLSSNLNPSIIKFRKEEEQKEEYKDAISNQCHYLNSPLQYDEFIETLESFASNSTAVGIDGISYPMLNHLPDSWKQLLHAFYQKCCLNETLPSIWKQSVIIPILKQGKPKSTIASYRPIALASHAGKIMEMIILKRLLHYCEKKKEKEGIIPVNQAGFRKGRCTIDHLAKLTSHIKKQLSRRKSTLATFFFMLKRLTTVCGMLDYFIN